MPIKARLLIDEKGSPPWRQMAIDEAILKLHDKGESPPTLRFYIFNPSSITIGYFQKIRDAVNLEKAHELSIPVVRRISGGGSVYHDRNGEVTYSIVLPCTGLFTSIAKSYEIILRGLIKALDLLGVNAKYIPPNDVIVKGKKISGSAQARISASLLQHGTLLYAANLSVMEAVLKAPKKKLLDHGATSIRDRVTTLEIELGAKIHRGKIIEALIQGFSEELDLELNEGELSEKEEKLISELEEKYKSREWNYRR